MEDFYKYVENVTSDNFEQQNYRELQAATRRVEYKMYEIPKDYHIVFIVRLLDYLGGEFSSLCGWKGIEQGEGLEEYRIKHGDLPAALDEMILVIIRVIGVAAAFGYKWDDYKDKTKLKIEDIGATGVAGQVSYVENAKGLKACIRITDYNKPILKQKQISVLANAMRREGILNRDVTNITLSECFEALTGYSRNTIRIDIKTTEGVLERKEEVDEIINALQSVINKLEKDKREITK